MQIWNGCNGLNIAGNPIKDINAKLTFLSSGSVVERWLNFPSCLWHLVEILEILLLHVLSNDACKCAINSFLISWEPFENVNLLYFLLWMQIWNGCNALNIAGNPIKDINSKLAFLSSRSKVERKMINPPVCDIWWKSWKCFFCMYSRMMDANLPQTFFPSAESHFKMLIYYMLKGDSPPHLSWAGCLLKFFSLDLGWTWWMMIDFAPRFWYLVEILEILLFYILSCDACKFATNLFYPSAESHLKMLIYYNFTWECRFEMAVMCLKLQETP